MLSYKRLQNSKTEQEFIDKYILSLPGDPWQDDFGNIHIQVGGDTKTLFSCHIDTVHRTSGKQNVLYDPNLAHAFIDQNDKSTNCLGADDGAGIWLMCEMIRARKDGYYIFHREEESGGNGSSWLAQKMPDMLRSFDRAVAFDRKGTTDIITFQRGKTCASPQFAEELSKLFAKHGINGMKSEHGTFTDTANYMYLIPECTNISCGYYWQHGPRETLDVLFLDQLRAAVIAMPWETLPVVRVPKKPEVPVNRAFNASYYDDWYDDVVKDTKYETTRDIPFDDAEDTAAPEDIMYFVIKRPHAAAKLLEYLDVTYEDIRVFSQESKQHLREKL